MEILQQPGGCLMIRHDANELSKRYLLISDIHLDNPSCNRKLLTRHLDEAVATGAGIMIFGDLFDAMQSKSDRRHNKADLMEELKVANYLDALVYQTAEFFEPYKHNLNLVSTGNHESSYLQKLETDLLQRLVDELDVPSLYKGGYQGFVRFQHLITSTSKRTNVLFYHHGLWGGVVSQGTQASSRYASITPDANIIVSGHTHNRWALEFPRYKLTQNGSTKVSMQIHVKTGTYKEEFDKNSGWAVEKIGMPKNMGGWWLTFHAEDDDIVPRVSMT